MMQNDNLLFLSTNDITIQALPQIICDMIKEQELDVANIDVELQAKNWQILTFCFTFFRNLKSLQPDVQSWWDLDQNVAF